MIALADVAPPGTGLAIVGLVLLAFVAAAIGVTTLVVVLVVKSVRRRRRAALPAHPPMPQPGMPPPA